MQIKPFRLERFFAQHEFTVDYLLSASDCESLSQAELLDLADEDAQRLWEELDLGYTESQGHPLLREEIAGLYQTISPAETIVAAPEEAIFIAMNCLLRPGDHMIATFPAYQSLHEIAKAINCDVTRWTLTPKDGHWTLDLDFLQKQINDRTRLIVVNFPHNPTGFLPSRHDFESIIQIARQHDVPLFCDEMYWRLEHVGREPLPAVCDLYQRGISLFGMSKTFSLPGLRIGWLATRDAALMASFTTMKDYTTICNSAPSEILALIALRARDTIVDRSRRIIQSNLEIARQFFAEHTDLFAWIEPAGGSIAFPRYRASIPLHSFCQELLETRSALLVPGDLFDVPNHFRLGLGRADLPAGLQQVDAFIHSSELLQDYEAGREI